MGQEILEQEHIEQVKIKQAFNTSKKKLNKIKVLYSTDFNATVKISTFGKHQDRIDK